MQVVHSNLHRGHVPRWYIVDGEVTPAPDDPARADRILDALRAAGSHQVVPPSVDPMPAIRLTHEPRMLEYLHAVYPLWKAEFGDTDVIPDTFLPRNRPADTRPPTKLLAQAGFWCFDMAAPITAGTYAAAIAAAGCAVTATEVALRGARGAYALCRPPGHHAGRDYFGGFCYLNNVAVAAHHALARGIPRLAILDVDYHHGNGTQDIFYDDPRVLTASLHADPNTMYPYFWGHADELGRGPGAGANLNVPLPRGSDADAWFDALDACLRRVRAFAPTLLLVSLGVDACEHDPVCDFKLAVGDFAHIGATLAQLGVPTVFVQEGGYNLDLVGPCVANVLEAFEG